jgi:hypothetical protein
VFERRLVEFDSNGHAFSIRCYQKN